MPSHRLSSLVVGVALIGTVFGAADRPSFLFILADDIGWGDMHYNGGTARTPRIDAWAQRWGSIKMQDFHSGGTVCSPTRATVLTGRNHFRDCVGYVYDCSDPTECTPNFEFAPQRSFSIADAARQAGVDYSSMFFGKWHLGSFYNDSEKFGGTTSSPLTHGFDRMNATIEVAPSATANCLCNEAWKESCNFGHYQKPTHCTGGFSPGGHELPKGCCFNYWREDAASPHGVSNQTEATPDDDSVFLADSFDRFLEERGGKPFLAQLSFHNCHMPYIGTHAARQACRDGVTCEPSNPQGVPSQQYNDFQLDYYACLNELDASVGRVVDSLDQKGYYENTMVWFTTDNGPEGNCAPAGLSADEHYREWPGSSGKLRGRKRDIWEGGHRVPGVVSWPRVVNKPARESWDTVVTMDFLPTVMEVLGVHRPAKQLDWAVDGLSIMPILQGKPWPERGIGWRFQVWHIDAPSGFRYGNWKYVNGSTSCQQATCKKELLYDLSKDLEEKNNVGGQFPDVLAAIRANFTKWRNSIDKSRNEESKCRRSIVLPAGRDISSCRWHLDTQSGGSDVFAAIVETQEECCGLCHATLGCVSAGFTTRPSSVSQASGVFLAEHLSSEEKRCRLKNSEGHLCGLCADGEGAVCCMREQVQSVIGLSSYQWI